MFRSRAERLALLAVAVAALALAGAASAQPGVVELELPVVDLSLPSSDLDNSVEASESAREVRLTLAADVLFRFNQASLTPRARSRLDQVVRRMRSADPSSARVDGYTDSRGSDDYNDRLSRRRASAVATALERALGGSGPRLRTVGHGEEDPVAANQTEDGDDYPRGRAKNRRVTVSFGR